MAISAAGREYRTQDVGDERYWTCETCGALVGPLKRNQEQHDAWHAKHGD